MQRYGSTPSGAQAHVLLAQVHYDKGEYQQGMKELEPVTSDKDAYTAATALNLEAAGLEQSGKLPEAAAAYQKAAARAPYKIDQGRLHGERGASADDGRQDGRGEEDLGGAGERRSESGIGGGAGTAGRARGEGGQRGLSFESRRRDPGAQQWAPFSTIENPAYDGSPSDRSASLISHDRSSRG